jgi:hypothetical protein
MTMRTLLKPFVTAVLMTVLGSSGMAVASPQPAPAIERPLAAEVAKPVKAAAPSVEAARYAARETKSQNLEQFKGGAGLNIYIGGTALAIAAFIVLLLVLL